MASLATLPACCGPECADKERARDTAIEAARSFVAAHLWDERHGLRGIFATQSIATSEVVEALQSLRDCLHAERCSRG